MKERQGEERINAEGSAAEAAVSGTAVQPGAGAAEAPYRDPELEVVELEKLCANLCDVHPLLGEDELAGIDIPDSKAIARAISLHAVRMQSEIAGVRKFLDEGAFCDDPEQEALVEFTEKCVDRLEELAASFGSALRGWIRMFGAGRVIELDAVTFDAIKAIDQGAFPQLWKGRLRTPYFVAEGLCEYALARDAGEQAALFEECESLRDLKFRRDVAANLRTRATAQPSGDVEPAPLAPRLPGVAVLVLLDGHGNEVLRADVPEELRTRGDNVLLDEITRQVTKARAAEAASELAATPETDAARTSEAATKPTTEFDVLFAKEFGRLLGVSVLDEIDRGLERIHFWMRSGRRGAPKFGIATPKAKGSVRKVKRASRRKGE